MNTISKWIQILIPFFSLFSLKDQKVNSSNIDSLLQELKIMGYIGHHVNIIQLIGCFTAQLVTYGKQETGGRIPGNLV